MRRFILMVCATIAMLASASVAEAQNVVRNGKTYEAVKAATISERATGFTYKDSKGREYPIFMGKSGSCYVKKVSAKTGAEYKQYLGEEISRDICKSLGVEYTGKSSK